MKRLLYVVMITCSVLGCGAVRNMMNQCCPSVRDTGRSNFVWNDDEGQHLDLLLSGKQVVRYIYVFDDSSEQSFFETGKPFLSVFDPSCGQLLTKELGGLYPHHRGIFIGWNKTTYGDQTVDFWHMKGGAQAHQRFLKLETGEHSASMSALIHWNDTQGTTVISEVRTMTVHVPGDGSTEADALPLVIDFHSVLTAPNFDVLLNGDPEHAGVHFRASQEVAERAERIAKSAKEAREQGRQPESDPHATVYHFHAQDVDPHVVPDLPWAAMSFSVGGKRYTVTQENHPDNPKSTLYSAYRDYGRFGAFFRETVKKGESLTVRYRFRIARQNPM